jgi:hypothetical protein
MVKKIALEEHVLTPGLVDYWRPTVTTIPKAAAENFYNRLTDFGGQRLEGMDRGGIARAVLSVAGPGVQAEHDAAIATKRAAESNDFLAKEIQKRPDRYAGFAHIAVQDPKAAADELERALRDLKFCGAMINGHTNGQYLDDAALAPFWERADALGAIIYIHPADPVAPLPVLEGYKELARPMWGWGVEHRLARAAPDRRRPFRTLSARPADAWPSRRDAAVPAVAARQPRQIPGREAEKSAVALHQEQRLRDDIRHVRRPAAALFARCARPRPRDVCRRLSVRKSGRGGALHGQRRDRRGLARRCGVQQRGAGVGDLSFG